MASFLTKAGLALARLAFIECLAIAFFILAFNQTVLDENSYGPALQSQGLDSQLHESVVGQFTGVLGAQVDVLTSDESLNAINEAVIAQGGKPLDIPKIRILANAFKAKFRQELGTRFTPGDLRNGITDIVRRVLRYLKSESNTIDLKPPVRTLTEKLFTSASQALHESYPEFSTGLRAEFKASGIAESTLDGLDAQVAALETNLAGGNLTGSGVGTGAQSPLAALEASVDAYTQQATAPDCPPNAQNCTRNPLLVMREYITFLIRLPLYLFAASLVLLALIALLEEGTKARLKAAGMPLLIVGLMLLTTGFLTDQVFANASTVIPPGTLGPEQAQVLSSLQNPSSEKDGVMQAIIKVYLALFKQLTSKLFNWGIVVTLVAIALLVLSHFIKQDDSGEASEEPKSKPGGLEAFSLKK